MSEATAELPAVWDNALARRRAWQALGAYAAFSLLLPLVSVPHHRNVILALMLVILPTAAFMLLQLWLAWSLVDLRPRPSVCGLAMAGALALWLLALFLVRPHHGWTHGLNLSLFLLRPLLMGLGITLACTFFGVLLSRIVREPNVLLPVALVAMPVDYLGAMTPQGFTQNMVKQNPGVVQAVSVPVPVVHGLHLFPLIGPGDALFMAFFFAIVLRLDMNRRGTFWWMYGLLTLTMLLVLFYPINVAALIPMGLAVLIANGRFFRLKREEVFATLYAVLLVVALAAAFYAYSHAHFFRH